jgi:PBP1b-binding outer membrane lipoprotein LpoB
MYKWLIIFILVLFPAVLFSGCNTRAQTGITNAEIVKTLDNYNEVDLYTAASLAQLAVNEVEVKILVLQVIQKVDTEVDYTEQIALLNRQLATRKEYLELLYKRVYE